MKKLTLIKLVFVVASAVVLYGQATSGPTPGACPPICSHLTCRDKDGDLRFAHCVNGQCVCP
jgi:hypothetical protein